MSKSIYFVKPVDFDGPIKIGCSANPMYRLDVFNVWSPWPLEIIGTVPGNFEDESFLHSCFFRSHLHREWFHSSPKLRRAIEEVLAAGSVSAVKDWLKPEASVRSKTDRRRLNLRAANSAEVATGRPKKTGTRP